MAAANPVPAAIYDCRPWYSRADARALLRLLAANPPRTILTGRRFHRSVEEWQSFNPADDRVAQLREIADLHLRPLFDGKVASELLREAGAGVTPDMAIDAVLPQPIAGNAGDPGYLARLPKIDLTMGRAAG